MSKKIIIFCFGFDPLGREAVSKEIISLRKVFKNKVFIYSLSMSFGNFCIKKDIFLYYYKLLPLLPTISLLSKFSNISHIYTSVNDIPFLRLVLGKRVVLTSVEGVNLKRLKNNRRLLKEKVKKIIVQSEKDRKILVGNGIPERKIGIVYPGVDLEEYRSPVRRVKKNEKLKILFASSPLKKEHFFSRGVDFLFKNSGVFENSNLELTMLWRRLLKGDLDEKYGKHYSSFVKIVDRYINDMPKYYSQFHATILPYCGVVGNKSCPHSLIESLAAGKPVLVSEDVGISDLIEKEKCGVVFKLSEKGLENGIYRLRENYSLYQSKTVKVAKKYFSEKMFIYKHKKLYLEIEREVLL